MQRWYRHLTFARVSQVSSLVAVLYYKVQVFTEETGVYLMLSRASMPSPALSPPPASILTLASIAILWHATVASLWHENSQSISACLVLTAMLHLTAGAARGKRRLRLAQAHRHRSGCRHPQAPLTVASIARPTGTRLTERPFCLSCVY